MSLLSRVFQIPSQPKGQDTIVNKESIMSASPEDRKRLIFYLIASKDPQKLASYDHKSFSQRRLEQVRMYEEAGALGICTAYVMKSPLFRSWITKNFYLGLGLHLGTSVAVYSLSGKFLRTYIEPRFIAKDPLVGELAEKYNFSVNDVHQIEENTNEVREEVKPLIMQLKDKIQSWL